MPQPMSSLRGTWPNSLLLSYLVHPSTLLAVLRGRGAMVALRCCCRCAATAQCSFAAAIVLEFVVVLQADRDGIVGTFNARRACNDQETSTRSSCISTWLLAHAGQVKAAAAASRWPPEHLLDVHDRLRHMQPPCC
eukprot:GHRR01024415.1.p1 GENE.GHRR01024415.1~~GHRR01024415.1.p1  ORF type:complete len:136 (+),score=38.37 GHRR01024415.1:597-1004(+)